MLKRFYKSLFFGRRFYTSLVIVIVLFVLSYGLPFLFNISKLALAALALFTLLDYMILFFRRDPISVKRSVPDRFSNGDQNNVGIHIANNYSFAVEIFIIDEIPAQFQIRDFTLKAFLKTNEETTLSYQLRPTERGEYFFNNVNAFIKSPIKLIVRRKTFDAKTMVKVLPSYLLLKKYELLAYSSNLAEAGSKKMRKIGHSLEFEQIKEYVLGDDIRSINWKATARKGGQLMVNNYSDERSQQVYCIIDKGRVMKMPFDGMTLLDYSINASLILSSVALIKQDKAGLITFSDQIGSLLPADRKAKQMSAILETLYNQQTKFPEADYEKLFALVRMRITQRSLILLFTNFESMSALQRQLPFIKAISKNHLLLVVFFENTGLKELTTTDAEDIEGIYMKTIAEKFEYEKKLIIKELQKHGIPAILTAPQNLTVSVVNKYLEIKARQAI
ncbi:MAG TPA: DUF58 domain-containing protein [Puia sp.]|nr:DUF58 domain-containing protein [Puia sp.]